MNGSPAQHRPPLPLATLWPSNPNPQPPRRRGTQHVPGRTEFCCDCRVDGLPMAVAVAAEDANYFAPPRVTA